LRTESSGVFLTPIYHLSVKIIGRGSGRSAVGAAAYRSGEELRGEDAEIVHDYSNMSKVLLYVCLLCYYAKSNYY
jgi:hypothetical protein